MVIRCNLVSTNKLDDHQSVYTQQNFHTAMERTGFDVVLNHAPVVVVVLVLVYILQMDLQSNLVGSCKWDCDLSPDILEKNKQ